MRCLLQLTPEEGNIHEISAGPDSPLAILDILSPPYNDGSQIPDDFTRPCNYYEELGEYTTSNKEVTRWFPSVTTPLNPFSFNCHFLVKIFIHDFRTIGSYLPIGCRGCKFYQMPQKDILQIQKCSEEAHDY